MSTLKNQIKSFTASPTKQEVTKFFVYLGGISGAASTTDDTDLSLVSRITNDEVSVVVPRVDWRYNAEFEPYYFGSSGTNSYCYSSVSGIVYLCVGKNQPTGLVGEGTFPSTKQPTHTNGIQLYSDGYAWMALYKLDFSLSKFLTETVLPVNTLYDYTTEITSGSYSSKYNSICYGNAGQTGSCYFYYNQDTVDPLTSIVYSKGDLVSGIGSDDWICSSCHSIGDALGYKSIHISSTNSSSVIIRNPIDELTAKINSNSIDPSDKYYIHYSNYLYAQNLNKSIVYLDLDVSSLSIEDRIVNTQTPEITILDPLGIGASAYVTTYYDIRRNAFIANGIVLRAGGENYINPSFVIPNATSHKLQHALNCVLIPDIGDPSTFLPTPKVSVIKQLSKSTLDGIGTNQTVFSKVGIIKNIKTIDGIDASLNIQPNESINGRLTTKIILNPVGSFTGSIVPDIDPGTIFIDDTTYTTKVIIKTTETTADSLDYSSSLVSLVNEYDEFDEPISSTLEIAGVDELSFNVLATADIISIDSVDYTVSDIIDPDFKINSIDYVTVKSLTNSITFDPSPAVDSSTKISFLI